MKKEQDFMMRDDYFIVTISIITLLIKSIIIFLIISIIIIFKIIIIIIHFFERRSWPLDYRIHDQKHVGFLCEPKIDLRFSSFPSCLNKETQKREIEFRGSQIVEIMFAIRETALQFCCPVINEHSRFVKLRHYMKRILWTMELTF